MWVGVLALVAALWLGQLPECSSVADQSGHAVLGRMRRVRVEAELGFVSLSKYILVHNRPHEVDQVVRAHLALSDGAVIVAMNYEPAASSWPDEWHVPQVNVLRYVWDSPRVTHDNLATSSHAYSGGLPGVAEYALKNGITVTRPNQMHGLYREVSSKLLPGSIFSDVGVTSGNAKLRLESLYLFGGVVSRIREGVLGGIGAPLRLAPREPSENDGGHHASQADDTNDELAQGPLGLFLRRQHSFPLYAVVGVISALGGAAVWKAIRRGSLVWMGVWCGCLLGVAVAYYS